MKAHGISPNGSPSKHIAGRPTKTEDKSSDSTSKKRKAEAFMEDHNGDGDDDEEIGNVKSEECVRNNQYFQVKEEDTKPNLDFLSISDTAPVNNHLNYGRNAYSPFGFGCNFSNHSSSVPSDLVINVENEYDLTSPYTVNNRAPVTTSPAQIFDFQPIMHQTTEDKGCEESPLVVE